MLRFFGAMSEDERRASIELARIGHRYALVVIGDLTDWYNFGDFVMVDLDRQVSMYVGCFCETVD